MLALLLAFSALVLPVCGATLTSGFSMPGIDWWTLGAISQYDFLPVLLLVGAFGLLVVTGEGRTGAASSQATSTAVVLALAACVLGFAYVGSAFQLRAGGPFDVGASGNLEGWSATRVMTVASLLLLGVVCAAVLVMAVRWMTERKAVPA